jgi:hypothetical protein
VGFSTVVLISSLPPQRGQGPASGIKVISAYCFPKKIRRVTGGVDD